MLQKALHRARRISAAARVMVTADEVHRALWQPTSWFMRAEQSRLVRSRGLRKGCSTPQHPLATHGAPLPIAVLSEHIQLIHTDSADPGRGGRFGVMSSRIWRLCNLQAKHGFLLAGFGFGMMPLHVVEADLSNGALVQIRVEDAPSDIYVIGMSAIYRSESPPGPAGRWFIDRLKQKDARPPRQKASQAAGSIAASAVDRRSPRHTAMSNGQRSR